jgi:uncharacterized membrane protein YbhN (UPF0104 family)
MNWEKRTDYSNRTGAVVMVLVSAAIVAKYIYIIYVCYESVYHKNSVLCAHRFMYCNETQLNYSYFTVSLHYA